MMVAQVLKRKISSQFGWFLRGFFSLHFYLSYKIRLDLKHSGKFETQVNTYNMKTSILKVVQDKQTKFC